MVGGRSGEHLHICTLAFNSALHTHGCRHACRTSPWVGRCRQKQSHGILLAAGGRWTTAGAAVEAPQVVALASRRSCICPTHGRPRMPNGRLRALRSGPLVNPKHPSNLPVRSHSGVPQISWQDHRVAITGLVERPAVLTMVRRLALCPKRERSLCFRGLGQPNAGGASCIGRHRWPYPGDVITISWQGRGHRYPRCPGSRAAPGPEVPLRQPSSPPNSCPHRHGRPQDELKASFPTATVIAYMACVGGRRTEIKAAAPDLPVKGVDLSATAIGNSKWTGGCLAGLLCVCASA
jgi:hypothetical protein